MSLEIFSEKVSIVVPVLNEERYIQKFLDSVLEQNYPRECLEVILIDGGSSDNTLNLIKTYTEKYDFIRLLNNPKMTVQHALNLGIENSSGEYIVRMDAHAWYAKNYVSECIKCLKRTGADNVGGPTVATGRNGVQKVIAAAYGSPFALGGGDHYKKDFEGYSDTVSWGCFRKDYIVSLGMYDQKLPRSEDDDLNFRIIKNGGKIYISSKIRSEYYPRDTFQKLWNQYFEYGFWKPSVMKKHGTSLRISQIIPALFVAFWFICAFAGFFGLICRWFFGRFVLNAVNIAENIVLCAYLLLNFYFSFKNEFVSGFKERLLLMWAHCVIHVAYGSGFLVGILRTFGRMPRKDMNQH